MSRLFELPARELSFSEKVGNVLKAYGFLILWLGFIYFVLNRIGLSQKLEQMNFLLVVFNDQIKKFASDPRAYIFFVCVLAPFYEELLFRETALRATLAMPWIEHARYAVLTSVILFVSVIFGRLHGSVLNIFLQGMGGVVLSWVYIKNGRSYMSSVVVHALYNATIIGAAALKIVQFNILM